MNKKLLSIIDVFYKLAEIPVYQKCKQCGDTDPYMGDEGLCYKCFDPSKPKDIKIEEKPISSKVDRKFVVVYNEDDYIEWKTNLDNGLTVRVMADKRDQRANGSKNVKDFKIVDIIVEQTRIQDQTSFAALNKFIEKTENNKIQSLKDFSSINYTQFSFIPVENLDNIIDEISQL